MRLVFALVAVVALVVGCTPEAVESPTPTPSPVETTVTPSESPTVEPPSPSPSPSPTVFQSYPVDLPTEDPEAAAIIEGWQEYQRVIAKFSSDPLGYTDFSETQLVTAGGEQNIVLDMMSGYREDKVKILGGLAFTEVSLGVPSTNPQGESEAELSYCLDRSAMRVQGYDGVIEDTSTLIQRYPETATLVKGADGVWRVKQIRNDQEQSCEGS